MTGFPCKACRRCPGAILREAWEEGWRPGPTGSWRKEIPPEEGRLIVKQFHRGETTTILEIETDRVGTRYYKLMGGKG